MSLQNDIDTLKEQLAKDIPVETLKTLGGAINGLKQSGIEDKSLKKGDKAPAFVLPNALDKMVSSTDLLAQGPLVLSFYRGGW